MTENKSATEELIERLAGLPGVGRKTAEKFAFHILNRPREEALALARAIEQARCSLVRCSRCFNVSDCDPCAICCDPRRDGALVCVVENARDVIAMERTGVFRGLYHVLGGHIAPLENVGPDQLTIDQLVQRVRRERIREVVLATNPTLEGDATALHVARTLADEPDVSLTRIATGIPSGANIEHVSHAILAEALQQRKSLAQKNAEVS